MPESVPTPVRLPLPLHVLVYGSIDADVCDSVRLGVYRDLLPEHGVELRTWGEFNDYQVQVPPEYEDRLDDAVRDGVAKLDLSPIEWADVLVFRRCYGTVFACDSCDFAATNDASLQEHAQATGHRPAFRDRIIRDLLTAIERDPAILRGRAMVYEVDDDLLTPQPWTGTYRRIQGDLDLIERFARRADLVTVATPTLAASLSNYNDAVRVVRNAVNPEWYEHPASETDARPLSFLFYGVAARLRDYAICRDAVDEAARATGAPRVWLGSDDPAVRAVVDEALPFIPEVRGFARRLAEARPAIGLAPGGQDRFSRGRSELHWLEYSLAGAATVASQTMGGGPYDVIREGVDGLLARNRAEWREKLRRLAASPQMREDLAGRARERVLAEYHVRKRAAEWADAFRWAAEHAGRGLERSRRGGVSTGRSAAAVPDTAGANKAGRPAARGRAVIPASGRAATGDTAPAAPLPTLQPTPQTPTQPPAAAILEAYVAAQAFAGRSPLRLLLGADGSTGNTAVRRSAADGWITIDTAGDPDVRHDVVYGLPFGDGSVDAIDAYHVFEKLGELAVVLLAGEAARVLRPGGTLRVLTSDRVVRLPVFTAYTLERLLANSGFGGVVTRSAVEGDLVLEATRRGKDGRLATDSTPYLLYQNPYRHNSAGVRALHRLVHELNVRGIAAYAAGGNPAWNEPPPWRYTGPSVEPIVIYPEIVSGNPLNAGRVVRWVLNTPGYLGGDKAYSPNERVFTWSKKFVDAPLLTVDVTEHDLFNTDGVTRRDIDCFYVNKGPLRGAFKDAKTDGMTEITHDFPPTREGLAALLKRTRTLYTYDDCTSLANEALDCGCEVMLLPEGTPVSRGAEEDHGAHIEAFIAATQDW